MPQLGPSTMIKIQNEINKRNLSSVPRFSLSYCEEIENDIFLYSVNAHEMSVYTIYLDSLMTTMYPHGIFETAITYKHVKLLCVVYSCSTNHEQRNNHLIAKIKEMGKKMACEPWMEIRSTGSFHNLNGKLDLANPYQGYNINTKTIEPNKFVTLYKKYHSNTDYVFDSNAVSIFKKNGLL
jgi:hypothetical protein